MGSDPFFIIAAIASLAVVVILVIGIAGFARGGEFNRRNGNKMMRLRIIAQFGAVMLILLFVLLRGE